MAKQAGDDFLKLLVTAGLCRAALDGFTSITLSDRNAYALAQRADMPASCGGAMLATYGVHVRQQVLARSDNKRLLSKYANSRVRGDRVGVARNPLTPKVELIELVGDSSGMVMWQALVNPTTPESVVGRRVNGILESHIRGGKSWRSCVNVYAPILANHPSLLSNYVTHSAPSARALAARSVDIDAGQAEYLVKHASPRIWRLLASNPVVDASLLGTSRARRERRAKVNALGDWRQAIESRDPDVQQAVAASGSAALTAAMVSRHGRRLSVGAARSVLEYSVSDVDYMPDVIAQTFAGRAPLREAWWGMGWQRTRSIMATALALRMDWAHTLRTEPLKISRVRELHLLLGDDTQAWETLATLVGDWHGSLEELARTVVASRSSV